MSRARWGGPSPVTPSRRRRRRQRGQAMVELALTFPLLIVLAVSVADYGYYIEHVNNISTVVRDAARYASENTVSEALPWTSVCPNPTYSSGTGTYSCPGASDPSATVQGVVQLEAESLTVPEGGLPLDNVDCVWSGGTPASVSGLTGTAPGVNGSPALPTAFPSGSGAAGTPESCMTVAYYSSSDGSYSRSSLTLYGWWSSDQSSDAGCFEYVSSGSARCTTENYPVAGDLVQVTVMYSWSTNSPGPAFTVLNSTFGIRANITATYSFVVSSAGTS